ncbi:MAG: thiol oxidoreductase [Deltaproteobacteria bacterium]|nr:thiol oxidoreductase [Deltaproteobacteria bacterium]
MVRTIRSFVLALLLPLGCGEDEPGLAPFLGEELAGGETTVFDTTRLAYALHFRNLDQQQRGDHFVGNSFFNQNWVEAPASTEGRDGLGPVFNAKSCSACHFRDGRGRPPLPGEDMLGVLIRLSVPGSTDNGGPHPVDAYGGQLQPQGITGVPAEGTPLVEYEEVPGQYPDGATYSLRQPTYRFEDLAFGPLPDDLLISPRSAPAVFGLGLLEAVPEADILAYADPDDRDGDGISGRPNYPFDPITGQPRLGRFGWKANQPGLRQQNTGAFLGDLGITTTLRPGNNCAEPQLECQQAAVSMQPEADDKVVDRVTFYVRTLAPPARRDVDDPEVLAGRELFSEVGCADCHVASFVTEDAFADIPQAANQTIWPYTDMLLHDMGEALADGRPDFDATGTEWRTPPLWGLGLLQRVNEHTMLLHDGRARDAEEAILWHGGEAERSREDFTALTPADRGRLLLFLESL